MTGSAEHLTCREALGAYALGAVPEPEAERIRAHLETCQECRAELDWLRTAVDALPASVPPVQPPPELKQRLMAVVNAEAELLRAAGQTADEPPSPAPQRQRRWLQGWRLPATAALATAAVVAAIVVPLLTSGSSTRVVPVQLTAQASGFANAHASLRIRGDQAQLVVTGFPTPAAGHVEELWIKRGQAAPVPAGTFILHAGSVTVSQPVQRGDLVLMTVEPGRGTAHPTTQPLLVAHV
ncbi:MAG TPA: anti-sigma factor [Solirubrobacteraceae bacterium]|nr:anti-sigma factor [Solirubrobacteraceae bacterium]